MNSIPPVVRNKSFIVLLLFLALFPYGCTKKKFNSTEWKKFDASFGDEEKGEMAEDLVASHKLIGLNHKQMLDQLGDPVNDTTSTWYTLTEKYDVIDPVSGTYLDIQFNKDSIITNASIVKWHKH